MKHPAIQKLMPFITAMLKSFQKWFINSTLANTDSESKKRQEKPQEISEGWASGSFYNFHDQPHRPFKEAQQVFDSRDFAH